MSEYYDDPTKVGVWVAALLAFPELTFDAPWASLGRIRPVHTTGVIFGFAGNALIATSVHVMQRTTRARLPDTRIKHSWPHSIIGIFLVISQRVI